MHSKLKKTKKGSKHSSINSIKKSKLYNDVVTSCVTAKSGSGMEGDRVKLFGKRGISPYVIRKFQSYYSKAIRDNVGDVKLMKDAVWSTYHHSETDKAESHKFCSSKWP